MIKAHVNRDFHWIINLQPQARQIVENADTLEVWLETKVVNPETNFVEIPTVQPIFTFKPTEPTLHHQSTVFNILHTLLM